MNFVLAQVKIGQQFGSPYGESKSLGDIVSILLNGGLVVAGVIIVFLLVGGGLQMIMGAGNNDPKASAAGHQAITWAVIGFIIVFSTFLIIRLIETITGVSFVTQPLVGGQVLTP